MADESVDHDVSATPTGATTALARSAAVTQGGGPAQFSVSLMHSPDEVSSRVNSLALTHYIQSVERLVKGTGDESRAGLAARISIALFPQLRPLVEVQVFAPEPREAWAKQWMEQFKAVALPPVRGAVAFVVEASWEGGLPGAAPKFTFPFSQHAPGFREGTADDLVYSAAGLPNPAAQQQSATVCQVASHQASHTTSGKPARSRWSVMRVLQRIAEFFLGVHSSASSGLCPHCSKPQRNSDHAHQPTSEQAKPAVEPVAKETGPPWPEPANIESLTTSIAAYPEYLPFYQARGTLLRIAGRFEEALADFEKILQLDATNLDAIFARGICLLCWDRLQPALADFNQTLERLPKSDTALAHRAEIYRRLEAWAAADADLTAAIEIDPFNPCWPAARARIRAAHGRLDDALRDAQTAIDLDPNDDEYFALHGSLLFERDDAREPMTAALRDFERAAALAPQSAAYATACGDAHLRLRQPDEAVAACARALALDADFARARGIRGAAEELRNGPVQAIIDDCTAAIDQQCAATMVYFSRASAYCRQHDWSAALADLDIVVRHAPNYAPAYDRRGAVRGNLQMDELARDDFERAIELAPAWSEPYLKRAVWFQMHGNPDAAVDDCDLAIACDPSEIGAYLLRAKGRAALGKLDLARQDLDTAVQQGAEFVQPWSDRGSFLFHTHEYEAARKDLDQALKIEPDHLESLLLRSRVLLALRESDAALVDADRLIALRPNVIEAYTNRGNVWLQKENPRRAEQDFNFVIAMQPEMADDLRVNQILVQSWLDADQERFDKAIAALNALIDEQPDCALAYRNRARALWYSEQFVEAIEDYTRFIEHASGDAAAHGSRGQVWAELGEFDRALADADQALALLEDHQTSETIQALVRNGRGLALAGLARYPEAIAEFERSIRLRPQSAWSQFNLGLTYRELGEREKAAVCFRLSLELDAPRLSPRKRAQAKTFLDRMASA